MGGRLPGNCLRMVHGWPTRSFVALTCLSVAAGVIAAEPGESPTTVSGVVVDADGHPVAGVNVSISWSREEGASVETDNAGRFELKRRLNALGRHTFVANDWDNSRVASLEVRANQLTGDLKLELAPAQVIKVRAVNGDGRPVVGAKAGVLNRRSFVGGALTDKDGKAQFLLPSDQRAEFVFAFLSDVGMDYRALTLPDGSFGDKLSKPPEYPKEGLDLVLNGTKPLRVRVLDNEKNPIAGVRLYPWYVKKEEQPQDLNLSYFVDELATTTNEQGEAEFAWMPNWQTGKVTVWPTHTRYVRSRGMYDPTADDSLVMTLDALVAIRGRVLGVNGQPAAGVTVNASGAGYTFDSFREQTSTDADGRYEILAAPNMVYLVTAKTDKLAAEAQTGFAVMPGQPVNDLDFALQPAIRVFGQVTLGESKQPVAGQRISVYQFGESANKNPDVKLPNPENSRRWVQPLMVHSTTTSKDGRFSLLVGPGKFDIRGPRSIEVQKFTLDEEEDREFLFHTDQPERGLLRGFIVMGSPPKPVIGAELRGIYRNGLAGRDLQAKTNDRGRFVVERELHRTVVFARSADGKLAGIKEIEASDSQMVLKLKPLGTATGRLVDKGTGKPLANREIVYGVRVYIGDDTAPFRTSFGGRVMTDDDGKFHLKKIVVGHLYRINVTAKNGQSWQGVGTITAKDEKPIELGDLKL